MPRPRRKTVNGAVRQRNRSRLTRINDIFACIPREEPDPPPSRELQARRAKRLHAMAKQGFQLIAYHDLRAAHGLPVEAAGQALGVQASRARELEKLSQFGPDPAKRFAVGVLESMVVGDVDYVRHTRRDDVTAGAIFNLIAREAEQLPAPAYLVKQFREEFASWSRG